MHTRLLCGILILAVAITGCTLAAPSAPVLSATPIRYPATWTPEPTFTPRPPTATATLVVPDLPLGSVVKAKDIRRVPDVAYGAIGAWADSTHLSKELLPDLAPHVQLATGPQAFALRQFNPRIMALESFTGSVRSGGVPTVGRSYDGALVELANDSAASLSLLDSFRSRLGTRLLVARSNLSSANSEEALSTRELWSRVDGVCICGYLRAPKASLDTFEDEGAWKKDVDALSRISSFKNSIVLVATPFDLPRLERPRLQQWFEYALASFLLGVNGTHTYFSFQGAQADDFMSSLSLRAQLGYPLGPYYQTFGIYQRRFSRGLVLVNAGNFRQELPLARTYVTSLGVEQTRASLEPHTGLILLIQQ